MLLLLIIIILLIIENIHNLTQMDPLAVGPEQQSQTRFTS